MADVESVSVLLSWILLMAAQKPITPADTYTAKEDLFAARLGDKDPSFEAIWKWGRPFSGKAVLGLPFAKLEVAVTPEGAVLVPLEGAKKLWLRVEQDGKPLFASKGREMHRFWPVVSHWSSVEKVGFHQTVWVASQGGPNGTLILHLEARGEGEARPQVRIAILDALPNLWQDASQKPKRSADVLRLQQGEVVLPGQLSLAVLDDAATLTPSDGLDWAKDLLQLPKVMMKGNAFPEWTLVLPLDPGKRADRKNRYQQAECENEWSARWKDVPEYSVPDPQMDTLVWKLLAQLLITAEGDRMVYGAFPSVYDNSFFGPEEGWATLALAEWGLKDDAERIFRGTFLTKEFIDKSDRHHQYRNGNLGKYAWWMYQTTGDKKFLKECLPHLQSAALWTMDQTSKTQNGLLAEYNYGGDLGQPAHALWPNACCWRGLRDTQLALDALGIQNTGLHRTEAAAYRKRIRSAFGKAKGRTRGFYPLSLEETRTTLPSPEYYQLFAPMILENGIFEPDSPEFKDIESFMLSTGRIQCGVPRFSPEKVAGIDAEYGYGRLATLLRKGDRRGFLLGVYGQIGLSMDPVYGTSPEVTPLLLDDAAMKKQHADQEERWGLSTEPCSAGVGVTLLYLRRMLAFEETDHDDLPTGVLQLLPAVPDRWWTSKKPWGVKRLPTAFGKLDLWVTPEKGKSRVTASLSGPSAEKLKGFALRVPPTISGQREWGWMKAAPKRGKATFEVVL
ncbi:MAG: hypothetical protein HZC36_13615 [Armatimonadetes bacterium]|nr:hypothetical protein [Armatimonadota bacterium]